MVFSLGVRSTCTVTANVDKPLGAPVDDEQ